MEAGKTSLTAKHIQVATYLKNEIEVYQAGNKPLSDALIQARDDVFIGTLLFDTGRTTQTMVEMLKNVETSYK